MKFNRRSLVLAVTTALTALSILVLPTLADELIGSVKSVDAENKTFVVKPSDGEADVDVTIKDETVIENEKGKVLKKFDIAKHLKVGKNVEVTHDGGMASKIALKKGMTKLAKKKGDRHKKMEKVEKTEKTETPDGKTEKTEKTEKTDDKTEKTEKSEKTEKTDKSDKS